MFCFFFFNDTATTEIYTLSLHDALPICVGGDPAEPGIAANQSAQLSLLLGGAYAPRWCVAEFQALDPALCIAQDRKSTRLNSSHANISYAVFCLKKKNR